jgi:carbon-monoxide dehydrogenase large subunit
MSEAGIGTPLRRVEDARLVTGQGQYADDIRLPSMLHAAFVRSPEAHARISSIDDSEALAIDGVVGVFTAADLGLDRPMPVAHPHPLLTEARTAEALATGEVCHAGQAVVVVVATDRYAAADGADAVWVEYDTLPAVAEVMRASEPDAPRVHADLSTNVMATMPVRWGDSDAAFERAHAVVRSTLRQHRGACLSMETRGVVASEIDGRLTVWSSTQSIALLRRLLSQHLGLSDVRVIAPDVGGGFGPKGNVYPEEYVIAALALNLGAPVKWIETRREHLLTTNQQRDLVSDLEVACDADGRMLGLRGTMIHDNGAFAPYGLLLPMTGLDLLQGPYTLGAIDITMDVVYTNAVPTSPIRGALRPNAAFIIERAIDAVADHLGIDRFEVRRRNFIPADAFPYAFPGDARYGGKITYDSGAYEAALDAVSDLADLAGFEDRKERSQQHGLLRGLGVASYVEDTGLGPFEEVGMEVAADGQVTVTAMTGSQGQGHATVYTQICASSLGIDPAMVTVRSADSDLPGTGGSTVASRTAVTAGSSAYLAAEALADRLREMAAERFEASEADIVLEAGWARVAGSPDVEVSLAELSSVAIEKGEPLSETGKHPTPRPPYAFGSHIAEVEVDPDTGWVSVDRYFIAHDCGTVLNPMIVDGQIDGGVVHGLSNALFERVVYDESGQPRTTTMMDIQIPTAADVPDLARVHTVTPAPDNPIGVKGAGEGGTMPVAAVIASAVDDALGVFVDRYPMTPGVVRSMIEEQSVGVTT